MLLLLTVCLGLAKEDGARSSVVRWVWLQGQLWENKGEYTRKQVWQVDQHPTKHNDENTDSFCKLLLSCQSTTWLSINQNMHKKEVKAAAVQIWHSIIRIINKCLRVGH